MKLRADWAGVVLLLLLTLAVPWVAWTCYQARPWAWGLGAGSLLAVTAAAGHGVRGRWDGVLIDERNRISLSRLQITLWSLLLLPAVYAAYISGVCPWGAPVNPGFELSIPEQLLALMGISLTSAVVSPLLLKRKEAASADDPAAAAPLDKNDTPADASWRDLLAGESAASAPVDLSRLQNLYFTGLALVVYGVSLWAAFRGLTPVTSLPPINSSLVLLIGISHGGYLIAKTVQPPTGP